MIFPEANEENRVRINLSNMAQAVFEADCINFGMKRNSLLNKIIENFYADANASIPLAVQQEQERLQNVLSEIDSEQKEQIIGKLLEDYKKRLQVQADRYEKGESFVFRLNNANARMFFKESMGTDDIQLAKKHAEECYNNKLSYYLKALIEEYAQKTYLEREIILFTSQIKQIKTAIEHKKQLHIVTADGQSVHIKPYAVAVDSMSNYHYLVGCRIITAENGTKLQNTSYRISRLQRIKETTASGFLAKAQRTELERELYRKDAQFMSDNLTEIKVYLTDEGIKKYNRILHLRPHYSRIDNEHIYVFTTTLLQIEFYFFKFGADAEILPSQEENCIALRKKFHQMYRDATLVYER